LTGVLYNSKISIRNIKIKLNILKIMDITIKQKKLIFIILSSALLIFILVFGISTYYKEKRGNQKAYEVDEEFEKIVEKERKVSDLCLSGDIRNDYRLCCRIQGGFKDSLYYDCTSEEYFEPNQLIYIILNASKFDSLYDPDLTQVYSDLEFDYNHSAISILGTGNLSRRRDSLSMFSSFDEPIIDEAESAEEEKSPLMKITGLVPQEGESFIMLAVAVYPDNTFTSGTGQVVLYREAKVSKE
jgi:hypothetical protein